ILSQIDINPKIKEGILIDSVLMEINSVNNAKRVVIPNIGFYNENTDDYVSGVADAGVITNKSIRRVSIDLENGNKRYFKQIDYIDGIPKTDSADDKIHGSTTGLKASAWQEINQDGSPIKMGDRQQIRLNFIGYSNGKDGHHDKLSRDDFVDGRLNPQTLEAAEFTSMVIQKLGKDNISNVIYGAHSMGAANAIVAHIVSNLKGVPIQSTLLLEPVGASSQVKKIKEAMQNEQSPLFKKLQDIVNSENSVETIKNAGKMLDADIAQNVVSIRTLDENKAHSRAASIKVGSGVRGVLASATRKNAGEPCHASNETLGTCFLMTIPKQESSSSEKSLKSWIARRDATHMLSYIMLGAYDPKTTYHELTDNQIAQIPAVKEMALR
ncbi:MAG: hypothetical protein ABL857_08745, partial [Rickettsiales bacterium]